MACLCLIYVRCWHARRKPLHRNDGGPVVKDILRDGNVPLECFALKVKQGNRPRRRRRGAKKFKLADGRVVRRERAVSDDQRKASLEALIAHGDLRLLRWRPPFYDADALPPDEVARLLAEEIAHARASHASIVREIAGRIVVVDEPDADKRARLHKLWELNRSVRSQPWCEWRPSRACSIAAIRHQLDAHEPMQDTCREI